MQISANDITIAAQCCNAAIDAAINTLAIVPCPQSCVDNAIIMLTIAHDYAGSILSMTDGSTTTPIPSSH